MTDAERGRAILLPDATLPELEERVECLETDIHLLKNEDIKNNTCKTDVLMRNVEMLLSGYQELRQEMATIKERDDNLMRSNQELRQEMATIKERDDNLIRSNQDLRQEMVALKQRDEAQQTEIDDLKSRNRILEKSVEESKYRQNTSGPSGQKQETVISPSLSNIVASTSLHTEVNDSSEDIIMPQPNSTTNSTPNILDDDDFERLLQSGVGDNEDLKSKIRSIRPANFFNFSFSVILRNLFYGLTPFLMYFVMFLLRNIDAMMTYSIFN